MAPQGAGMGSNASKENAALLADLLGRLQTLESTKKVEAATKVEAKKEIDWSKVEEKDILSLSIPVPTIDHALEGYLDVVLADKNYVARWVHKSQHNLGPKLNRGFTFVTKEDMDVSKPLPLEFDSEGHYSFDDVVCLKIHKSIYLGKLKQNMTRATKIQKQKELTNSHIPALSDDPAFTAAQSKGKMDFYDAGEIQANF